MTTVDERRHQCAVAVLGGPTTVIDVAGAAGDRSHLRPARLPHQDGGSGVGAVGAGASRCRARQPRPAPRQSGHARSRNGGLVGAARVTGKERNRPLTLTSTRAAAAAEILGARVVVAAHVDGWAHLREGVDAVVAAFDAAGIAELLAIRPHGEWVIAGRSTP